VEVGFYQGHVLFLNEVRWDASHFYLTAQNARCADEFDGLLPEPALAGRGPYFAKGATD
jgi:hypothetical protein